MTSWPGLHPQPEDNIIGFNLYLNAFTLNNQIIYPNI